MELVVGCAVLSENKAEFIQKIFSLNHRSQTVLKSMVERVMRRALPLATTSASSQNRADVKTEEYEADENTSEELLR